MRSEVCLGQGDFTVDVTTVVVEIVSVLNSVMIDRGPIVTYKLSIKIFRKMKGSIHTDTVAVTV
jgi:hypothetical protein